MNRFTKGLLVICLPWLCAAQVYRSTGVEGTTIYSDEPQQGSEKLEMAPLPGMKALTPAQGQRQQAPATPPVYTTPTITLLSPVADEAIRSNHGEVTVRIKLSATGLGKGEYIQIELDGQRLPQRYLQTEITLQNIDRGSHTIRAYLLNQDGAILSQTTELTFSLLRHSILFSR